LIAYAAEPIHTQQLIALGTRDRGILSEPGLIPTEEEILRLCGSLVRRCHPSNFVELAHFTVKEFLLTIDSTHRPDLAPYRLSYHPEAEFSEAESDFSDNDSLFSATPSSISSKSSNATEIDRVAADELVSSLFTNRILATLFISAMGDEKMAPMKLENIFRRLLKQFSLDLQEQIPGNEYKPVLRLIRSRARYIARCVKIKVQESANLEVPDMMKDRSNEKFDRMRMVERHLQDLSNSGSPDIEVEEMTADSESDIVASDDSDTELLNEKFPLLSKIRDSLLSREPFSQLCENLRRHIYPDTMTKFERLFRKLSKPKRDKLLVGISVGLLRRLASEVNSNSLIKAQIKFTRDQPLPN